MLTDSVSELCQALDARAQEFLDRPLGGTWVCLKARLGGLVAAVAATVATGVNLEGRREILGLGIGPPEARGFWVEFLRSLPARGLSGVRLVISDNHAGLEAAITQVLGTAAWRRCRVHFTRNLQARAPKDCEGLVPALPRRAFAQPGLAGAKAHWRRVADQIGPRLPRAAALMDGAEDGALARMALPDARRVKIHSANPPGAQQGGEARGRRRRAERRMDTGPAPHGVGDDGRGQRHPRPRAQGLGPLTASNLAGKNRTGIYTILTDATGSPPKRTWFSSSKTWWFSTSRSNSTSAWRTRRPTPSRRGTTIFPRPSTLSSNSNCSARLYP